MITRFLTVVLCGATLLLLSTATRMPILALVGGLCLLGGWAGFRRKAATRDAVSASSHPILG